MIDNKESNEILAEINYKLLKRARKRRRISIQKASENIIDSETLKKAEKGELKINFNNFRLLAERYRKNINYFYLEKEPILKTKIKWKIHDIIILIIKSLIRKWNLQDEFTHNI